MVNFGPVTAEIDWWVWGTAANFNGFCVLAALLHGTLVVGVSQTLWRWTEGATYIRQGGHHAGHWPTFLVVNCIATQCIVSSFLVTCDPVWTTPLLCHDWFIDSYSHDSSDDDAEAGRPRSYRVTVNKSSAVLRWATVPEQSGPKSGGLLCPFPWGELGLHLTQCSLGQGLPPYQVAS